MASKKRLRLGSLVDKFTNVLFCGAQRSGKISAWLEQHHQITREDLEFIHRRQAEIVKSTGLASSKAFNLAVNERIAAK